MTAKNRGAQSVESDFYATPEDCTRSMIRALWSALIAAGALAEGFRVLEPTAGKGAIVKVLREFMPLAHITAVELDRKRFELLEASGLCDEAICGDLAEQKFEPGQFDFAAVNPPFTIAKNIVDLTNGTAKSAAVLLRLGFLGSIDRRPWWQKQRMEPLYLAERPSFAASLKCLGADRKKKKDGCGWAVIQELEVKRPKMCPQCAIGHVGSSTSDSADYFWGHFHEAAPRVRVI